MKVEVSRLAQGSGTNGVGGSSNQTRKLGLKGLADLMQAAYDQGITFWDCADQYGTHPHVKEALKRVPREKVAILTKTHASTEKEARADLDRFRRELDTDYLDILLLHCMTDGDWPEQQEGRHERDRGGARKGHRAHARHLLPHARRAQDRRAHAVGAGGPGPHQPGRGGHGRRSARPSSPCCAR